MREFTFEDVFGGPSAGGRGPREALASARVDLVGVIEQGLPELEYVSGTAGAFVRGKRHHVSGEMKVGKSLPIGVVVSYDVVAAGGVAVVLDRENGATEYARRLDHVMWARGASPELRARLVANFRYYAWPEVRLEWGAREEYAQAFVDAEVVTFDSTRRFLSAVGLKEDSSDDFSTFTEKLVDPLHLAGIATVLLDNEGHANKGRARGTSSKGDLSDLVFSLSCSDDQAFSTTRRGRVELRLIHSRPGTSGTWELELGDGFYGRWQVKDEPGRERFHEAVLELLYEQAPRGREALIKAAGERGLRVRRDTMRAWLRELVGEGLIEHSGRGYDLPAAMTPRRGHSGSPPLEKPQAEGGDPLREKPGVTPS